VKSSIHKKGLSFACLLILFSLGLFNRQAYSSEYLTFHDIRKIAYMKADHRLYYGQLENQFADLRLPKGKGPFPVVVLIHGGCWLSKLGDLNWMSPLSEALTKQGYATWNIEYRSIDNPGGGWPGTFQDVGRAIDYLPKVANKFNLDVKQVVVVGHSAGGPMALWVAARHRLPKGSVIGTSHALPVSGVVDLAGPGDLKEFLPMQDFVCGEPVVTKLLGNLPSKVAKNMPQASPSQLLPLGVKQIVITGNQDIYVPAELGEAYVNEAKERGDNAEFIVVKDVAHFELIVPGSKAWPVVNEAVERLMNH
jgi:acetyl esterase/lipase